MYLIIKDMLYASSKKGNTGFRNSITIIENSLFYLLLLNLTKQFLNYSYQHLLLVLDLKNIFNKILFFFEKLLNIN